MNAKVNSVLAIMALTLMGCADLSKKAGFDVSPSAVSETAQPWQGHAVRVPGISASDEKYLVDSLKNFRVLTVSLDPVDNHWLGDGIQHMTKDGRVFYADVWRAMIFTLDGRVIEVSSILGDATGSGFATYTLIPGVSPERMKRWQLVRISSGSELVMTTRGKIVGAMSPDPAGREAVDVERLKADASYRAEFFGKHPSPIARVADFSPGTEQGKQFLGFLRMKYPASRKFPGANYLVGPEANAMAGVSPQHSWLDRFISNESVMVGTSLMAGPYGAAAFGASLIYSAVHAAWWVPSYGATDDQFNKLEVAAAWDELLRRHVMGRIGNLEGQVMHLETTGANGPATLADLP